MVKDFIKRNDYNEDDLKKKLKCKKPIPLRISSDGIEPKSMNPYQKTQVQSGFPSKP